MAALVAGTKAPQIELASTDGSKFSLQDTLGRGPVLAIFFKISCPVCQYALPYFERINKAYGGRKLTIIGVSQNEPPRHHRICPQVWDYVSGPAR